MQAKLGKSSSRPFGPDFELCMHKSQGFRPLEVWQSSVEHVDCKFLRTVVSGRRQMELYLALPKNASKVASFEVSHLKRY